MILTYLKYWFLKSKLWIGIAFAIGSSVLAAWLLGKREGKTQQREVFSEKEIARAEETAKNEVIRNRAETDKIVETIQNANEVKNETSNLSDDDVVAELRNKWSRD